MAAAKARIAAARLKSKTGDSKREAVLEAARARRAARPTSGGGVVGNAPNKAAPTRAAPSRAVGKLPPKPSASSKLPVADGGGEKSPVRTAPTRAAPSRARKEEVAQRLANVRASVRMARDALKTQLGEMEAEEKNNNDNINTSNNNNTDNSNNNSNTSNVSKADMKPTRSVASIGARFGAQPTKTVRRPLPTAQSRLKPTPPSNTANSNDQHADSSLPEPKKAAPRRPVSGNKQRSIAELSMPRKMAPRRPTNPRATKPNNESSNKLSDDTPMPTKQAPRRPANPNQNAAAKRAELNAKLDNVRANIDNARKSVRTVAVKVSIVVIIIVF